MSSRCAVSGNDSPNPVGFIMKEIPQQVSESVRKRNPHLYEKIEIRTVTAFKPGLQNPILHLIPRKRIRQSSKPKMNKLETEFFKKLQSECGGLEILQQAIRLELANGIWYKPDLFVPNGSDGPVVYEVKGPRAFRGGLENLKVAARVHRWCMFYLVWKDRGIWQRQSVLA